MTPRPPAGPEHDPWGAQPDPGRRARVAMTGVGWVALAVVVAGAAIGLSARNTGPALPPQSRVGLGLIGLGLLVAIAVVWHGMRFAHERGRRAAVGAIVLGSLAATPLLLRLINDARGW